MILPYCSYLFPFLHWNQVTFQNILAVPDFRASIPLSFLFERKYLLFFSQHPTYATRPTWNTDRKHCSEMTSWKQQSSVNYREIWVLPFIRTLPICRLLSAPHSWKTLVLDYPGLQHNLNSHKFARENCENLVVLRIAVFQEEMVSVAYPYTFKTNDNVPDSFGEISIFGYYAWESQAMLLKPSL